MLTPVPDAVRQHARGKLSIVLMALRQAGAEVAASTAPTAELEGWCQQLRQALELVEGCRVDLARGDEARAERRRLAELAQLQELGR